MENLAWLISGGFAKGYRTQVLGVTTGLSAVALWAVGDMSERNARQPPGQSSHCTRRPWPCCFGRQGG